MQSIIYLQERYTESERGREDYFVLEHQYILFPYMYPCSFQHLPHMMYTYVYIYNFITHMYTHTHTHKLISNTAISSLKPFYPSITYKLMYNWSVLQLYADPYNCIKEKRFFVVVASGPSPHPCLCYTVTIVPLHPSLLV